MEFCFEILSRIVMSDNNSKRYCGIRLLWTIFSYQMKNNKNTYIYITNYARDECT